ncbi:MAG: metallophosphoesterase [Tindallia sp. MSAO_Bac2]|nr:MAG: metallophosphoesterase [Tindallia sp. MSAO_Bac2]
MKIGVLGDTHGNIQQLNKAINMLEDCDKILHTGDFFHDIEKLEKHLQEKITAVAGNCDRQPGLPAEKILEIHNQKVFLCHGHQYGVKYDFNRLYYRALEVKADIAVFGHTHIPALVEEKGIYLINPGSASEPRISGDPTCLRLNLQKPSDSEFISISS